MTGLLLVAADHPVLAMLFALSLILGTACVTAGLAIDGTEERSRRLTPDPYLVDVDQTGAIR